MLFSLVFLHLSFLHLPVSLRRLFACYALPLTTTRPPTYPPPTTRTPTYHPHPLPMHPLQLHTVGGGAPIDRRRSGRCHRRLLPRTGRGRGRLAPVHAVEAAVALTG